MNEIELVGLIISGIITVMTPLIGFVVWSNKRLSTMQEARNADQSALIKKQTGEIEKLQVRVNEFDEIKAEYNLIKRALTTLQDTYATLQAEFDELKTENERIEKSRNAIDRANAQLLKDVDTRNEKIAAQQNTLETYRDIFKLMGRETPENKSKSEPESLGKKEV